LFSASTGSPTLPPTFPSDAKDLPLIPAISKEDQMMLFDPKFLQKLLLESSNQFKGRTVSSIVCHWCWENQTMTETVNGFIMSG
jgi:hypothetical protein